MTGSAPGKMGAIGPLSYILFFLAGFGFGYAAPGRWKFTPLVFPVLLAIGAFIRDGVSGGSILKLSARRRRTPSARCCPVSPWFKRLKLIEL